MTTFPVVEWIQHRTTYPVSRVMVYVKDVDAVAVTAADQDARGKLVEIPIGDAVETNT